MGLYGDGEKSGLRLGSMGQDVGGSAHSGGISQVNTSATELSKAGEPNIFYHGTRDNIAVS